MKIIDRYILLKFLKTFFFVVVVLNLIVCIIDYTEKSDDFIRENLPLWQILSEYYVNFALQMANLLMPISVFISVVFVTARMASHTEIVAILSSGVNFLRFLVPYLVGAIFIAAGSFILVGWVIPNAARTSVAFQVKYLKGPYFFDERNIHLKVNDSTYIYMESYMNKSNTGYKFTMENVQGTKLRSKLSADKIVWNEEKGFWNIPSYKVHTFNGLEESMSSGRNMDVALNVTPSYFESKYRYNETMTIPELDQYIAAERARGQGKVEVYLHEKYERYAYPVTVIILTLMGVLVSSRKSRQGSGFQIAIGFMLAFVFILFVIMSRSVAAAGSIPPLVAAWLPTATFSLITFFMYFTVKR
jgi:lipopolysaccharide export system permease protein